MVSESEATKSEVHTDGCCTNPGFWVIGARQTYISNGW